jgi:hypothetical protein
MTTTTTRPVLFSQNGIYESFPAGTRVEARQRKDGTYTIRVRGSLFSQHVYPAAVNL